MNNRKKNKRTEKPMQTKNRINSRSSLPNSHSDSDNDFESVGLNEKLKGRKRKNKKKGSESIPKKKRRASASASSIFIEEAGDVDNPSGDSDDASDNRDYEDDSRYYQRVYPGEKVQPLGSKIEDKKVYFQCQDNEMDSEEGHQAYHQWCPLLLDRLVDDYVQINYFKDEKVLLPTKPPDAVLEVYGRSIGIEFPSKEFTNFYEDECRRHSKELEDDMATKHLEFLNHSQDSSNSKCQLLGDSQTISTILNWRDVLEDETILEEVEDFLSVEVIEALCKRQSSILGDFCADEDFHHFIAYVMNFYITHQEHPSTSTADTGSDTTEMSEEEAVLSDTGESVGNEYSFASDWDMDAKRCNDVINAKPFAPNKDKSVDSISERNIEFILDLLKPYPVIGIVQTYFHFASLAFDPSEWHDDDDYHDFTKFKDALKELYGGLLSHPGYIGSTQETKYVSISGCNTKLDSIKALWSSGWYLILLKDTGGLLEGTLPPRGAKSHFTQELIESCRKELGNRIKFSKASNQGDLINLQKNNCYRFSYLQKYAEESGDKELIDEYSVASRQRAIDNVALLVQPEPSTSASIDDLGNGENNNDDVQQNVLELANLIYHTQTGAKFVYINNSSTVASVIANILIDKFTNPVPGPLLNQIILSKDFLALLTVTLQRKCDVDGFIWSGSHGREIVQGQHVKPVDCLPGNLREVIEANPEVSYASTVNGNSFPLKSWGSAIIKHNAETPYVVRCSKEPISNSTNDRGLDINDTVSKKKSRRNKRDCVSMYDYLAFGQLALQRMAVHLESLILPPESMRDAPYLKEVIKQKYDALALDISKRKSTGNDLKLYNKFVLGSSDSLLQEEEDEEDEIAEEAEEGDEDEEEENCEPEEHGKAVSVTKPKTKSTIIENEACFEDELNNARPPCNSAAKPSSTNEDAHMFAVYLICNGSVVESNRPKDLPADADKAFCSNEVYVVKSGTATVSAHDLNQTNLSGRNLSQTNLLADRVYEHSRQSGGSTHSFWAHLLHDTVIKAINDGVISKTYVESAWRYYIAAKGDGTLYSTTKSTSTKSTSHSTTMSQSQRIGESDTWWQTHMQKLGSMKQMNDNFQARLKEELSTLVSSDFETSYNIIPSTGKELLPMYDTDCTPCKYLFNTYVLRATAFCTLSIYSLAFQTIGALANSSCSIIWWEESFDIENDEFAKVKGTFLQPFQRNSKYQTPRIRRYIRVDDAHTLMCHLLNQDSQSTPLASLNNCQKMLIHLRWYWTSLHRIGVEGDCFVAYTIPAGKDANSQEPPLNITNLAFLSNDIMTNAKGSVHANYRFLICTSVNFDEFKRAVMDASSQEIISDEQWQQLLYVEQMTTYVVNLHALMVVISEHRTENDAAKDDTRCALKRTNPARIIDLSVSQFVFGNRSIVFNQEQLLPNRTNEPRLNADTLYWCAANMINKIKVNELADIKIYPPDAITSILRNSSTDIVNLTTSMSWSRDAYLYNGSRFGIFNKYSVFWLYNNAMNTTISDVTHWALLIAVGFDSIRDSSSSLPLGFIKLDTSPDKLQVDDIITALKRYYKDAYQDDTSDLSALSQDTVHSKIAKITEIEINVIDIECVVQDDNWQSGYYTLLHLQHFLGFIASANANSYSTLKAFAADFRAFIGSIGSNDIPKITQQILNTVNDFFPVNTSSRSISLPKQSTPKAAAHKQSKSKRYIFPKTVFPYLIGSINVTKTDCVECLQGNLQANLSNLTLKWYYSVLATASPIALDNYKVFPMDVFERKYDHRKLTELLCYKNIPEGEAIVHAKLDHIFKRQYLWFPCPSKCGILVLPGLPDLIEYCRKVVMASNYASLDDSYKYDKKTNCVYCATACAVCVIYADTSPAERISQEEDIKEYVSFITSFLCSQYEQMEGVREDLTLLVNESISKLSMKTFPVTTKNLRDIPNQGYIFLAITESLFKLTYTRPRGIGATMHNSDYFIRQLGSGAIQLTDKTMTSSVTAMRSQLAKL